MKKKSLKVAALLLCGALLTSSCIGSFSLFNNYEKWQCSMTENKFVNAIVGFFLQPIVGGVCLFVDALVLNSIEFWTGDNPVAATGKVQKVMGEDGVLYTITTTKTGYEVKSPDGKIVLFNHDADTDSWTMTRNGVTLPVDLAMVKK